MINITNSINTIYSYLRQNKLELAYTKARQLYKKNPNSIQAAFIYASLHGDSGHFLPPKKEKQHQQVAVKILKKLLTRLRGVDTTLRYKIKNEYYYHSGQFFKQFKLGQIHHNSFSIAVGASEYAWQLWSKNQKKRAYNYAKLSLKAWQKLEKQQTHNTFYYQAMAIAEDPTQATLQLKTDLQHLKQFDQQKRWFNKYLIRLEQLSASSLNTSKVI